MGYVGNKADSNYSSIDKQIITGNGGTSYTLSHSVANANEIEVFVNNVRQDPGVAYTVNNAALTMTGAVANTDSFYVVFIGKAVQTKVPPDGSVSAAKLASGIAISASTGTFSGGITATAGTFNGTGGQVTTDNSGHITSKQSLDVATTGGRFIGKSNRGALGQIAIEQTANSADGGYIRFATSASGSTSPTDRMRIDGTGNVGIGLTSPQELLHLKDGDIAVGNGTASNNAVIGKIGFSTDSSNSRFIGIESFRGSDAANADLRFHTYGGDGNNGERMRIANDGNVGIGTTAPDAMLHLSGGNEEAKIKFQVGTANADKFKIYASTAGRLYVNSYSGNTGVYLNYNGTSWSSNSDETLKDNITSLGTVGDKLKNYRTSYFTWKADTETPPKRNIGFIAQDWETDFPEVVTKKEGETLGMQYTETIPILLKYIQELEARLTAGGL